MCDFALLICGLGFQCSVSSFGFLVLLGFCFGLSIRVWAMTCLWCLCAWVCRVVRGGILRFGV